MSNIAYVGHKDIGSVRHRDIHVGLKDRAMSI